MKRTHHIKCDSKGGDVFHMHNNDGKHIKFAPTPNNLCAHVPSKQWMESELQLAQQQLPETDGGLDKVKKNELYYKERQLKAARMAKAILCGIGHPTVHDYKSIIQRNLIKDCPVTLKDIEVMEAVYGPDVAAIKGKSTRKKPTVV